MRFAVATTADDPLAAIFWEAYREAGGPAPTSVFFLSPRTVPPLYRRAVESIGLFGIGRTAQLWSRGRDVTRLLRRTPTRIFPGTEAFFYPESLNRGEGLRTLQQGRPDLLVSVGSPQIFKSPVLRVATIASLNIHNGRLPAYRGLFGTFWEMFNGEEWGYSTIHVMEEAVDAGAVIAQSAMRLSGRSLSDALTIKKRQGGRLLAWVVRFVHREHALPPACPSNSGLAEGYYSWPSLKEIALLRMRRVSRAFQGGADGTGPIAVWPPDAPSEER